MTLLQIYNKYPVLLNLRQRHIVTAHQANQIDYYGRGSSVIAVDQVS